MNLSMIKPTLSVSSTDPLSESRVEYVGIECQKDQKLPNMKKLAISNRKPLVESSHDDSEEEDLEIRILKERVKSLKKRLKTIEDKTNEEIEKLKVGVEEEITSRQQKAEASKATHASSIDTEELEKQGAEAKDTIESLRNANKKLREDSRELPRQIRELMAHNKALEESNEAFEKAKEQVHERLETEKLDYEKLDEILPQYRSKVREFEDSLESRTDLGGVENKIKKLYCDFNMTLVHMVKERSNDHLFVDEIVATLEAATLALEKGEDATSLTENIQLDGKGGKTAKGENGMNSDNTEATAPMSDSGECSINNVAKSSNEKG